MFPTLAVKHDATAFAMVYDDQTGGVNAGNEVEFFNPPIPGKKIRVTGRIADKYLRRDKPYMVIEGHRHRRRRAAAGKAPHLSDEKAGRGGQEMASARRRVMTEDIKPGQQIPSVTKAVTQDTINRFEDCGILDRQNIHNNPELAQQRLGTTYPIASGRMSVAFAAESLRRFFGPEVFQPHRQR